MRPAHQRRTVPCVSFGGMTVLVGWQEHWATYCQGFASRTSGVGKVRENRRVHPENGHWWGRGDDCPVTLITFHASRSWCKMYIGRVSVPYHIPTLLQGPGCNWGNVGGNNRHFPVWSWGKPTIWQDQMKTQNQTMCQNFLIVHPNRNLVTVNTAQSLF